MTYRLFKKEADGSKRQYQQKSIILRSTTNFDYNGQIYLNELEVGDYDLALEMDTNLTSPLAVRVISSSQTLSMNQRYQALKEAARAAEVMDEFTI